ncbi:MAG: DNA-directed RNA polymerase subunit beta' [Acetomicrobium sp.]|jgi:DNA-directed RNA polymerase subunit beta'|uniref:DNA-directed RNA polymerase subunit beta' n=1 Tax=Acetomicrobium mobile TaxID=97477 RepID=UPI0026F126BA|nr:DNA-directed RNA polymerase subunit beta' [Acetomicrobium mobile]MDI9376781.1 DNA-directed RNA polymerase subunit beta' [Synergistota bacterium]HQA36927.1 DNA-directed RNA polymerase subunit beta' [Acetomicrobium sp.]
MDKCEIVGVRIRLASPERIRELSSGEVKRPETINYRTLRPEKDGLFCERIFGPVRSYECACGKYKRNGPRFKGIICDRCGVEVTDSKVRRERMGHIELACPVVHIWYLRGIPSRLNLFLGTTAKDLERVIYFAPMRRRELLYKVVMEGKRPDLAKKGDLIPACEERIHRHYDPKFKAEEAYRITSIDDLPLKDGDVLSAQQVSRYRTEYGDDLFKVEPAYTITEIEEGATLKVGDVASQSDIERLKKQGIKVEFERLAIKNQEAFLVIATVRLPFSKDDIVSASELQLYMKNYPERFASQQETVVVEDPSYIVIDGSDSPFEQCDIIIEREQKLCKAYDKDFAAGIGAESILELLKIIDIDELAASLREETANSTGQKKRRLIKRLQVVEDFRKGDSKPEWMILSVLPVIPPDLRPMVQLDGGRFATSDLNDLYRRVINRNNRLKRLQELRAPEMIIRNEKRMLQEAVDALIDNGRVGKAVLGAGNRPLKSLTDLLRGKKGRFRQNLLGKRVDYSGRSVIVIGPELKLYQCGLPKEMALELFRPFVMHKLIEKGIASNVKGAKRIIERRRDEIWEALEEIIKDHPVMLNRAPTLHRLGIQAFEPLLMEGKAIRLHPLVCTAFNADFDGDQMAVHVPLSLESQAESRVLMLAGHNLLSPAHGRPIVTPTQDVVLGIYYLTAMVEGQKGEGMTFKDIEDVLIALDHGNVHPHAKVKMLWEGEFIETSPGRVLFNSVLHPSLRYINRRIAKKDLGSMLDLAFDKVEHEDLVKMLDGIKFLGYKWFTKSGVSLNIDSVVTPPEKEEIVREAMEKESELNAQYGMGILTEDEYLRETELLWTEAAARIADCILEHMDELNPLRMMVDSGARGSKSQLSQLSGIRGVMADPSGKVIDYPIVSNFREGLNMLEYFISTHGARKGLADTALRTAKSGYLTRRLVDVSQDLIILEEDCGTDKGVFVAPLLQDGKVVIPLSERVYGRTALEDVRHPLEGTVLVKAGEIIDQVRAEKIEAANIEGIWVRSPMTCVLRNGICQRCYGLDLSTRKPVAIGESVGIVAAQSIGEPGTQLTMRTFHTGGVRITGEDITQGLPRVEQLFEVRKPKKIALLSEIDGTVVEIRDMGGKRKIVIHSDSGDEKTTFNVPSAQLLLVEEGDIVKKGQILTEGYIDPQQLMEVKGIEAVHTYLVDGIQEVYKSQGVSINNKHIEVILRKVAPVNKVRIADEGDTSYVVGEIVWIDELEKEIQEIQSHNQRCLDESVALLKGKILRDVIGKGSLEHAAQYKGEVLDEQAIKILLQPGTALTELIVEDEGELVRVIVGESLFRRELEGLELLEPYEVGDRVRIEANSPLTIKQLALITQDLRKPLQVLDTDKLFSLCDVTYLAEDVLCDGEVIAHKDALLTKDIALRLKEKSIKEIKIWKAPETIDLSDAIQEYLISKIWGRSLSKVIDSSGNEPEDIPPIVDGSIVRGIIEGKTTAIEADGEIYSRQKILHSVMTEKIYGKVLLEPVKDNLGNIVVSAGTEINQQVLERIIEVEPTKIVVRPILALSQVERLIQRVIFVRKLRQEPIWKPVLLGITKAALATDSFLSAASFQQTAQALASAAVRGEIDYLRGLKENVIIGHLIPAGTGAAANRNFEIVEAEGEISYEPVSVDRS